MTNLDPTRAQRPVPVSRTAPGRARALGASTLLAAATVALGTTMWSSPVLGTGSGTGSAAAAQTVVTPLDQCNDPAIVGNLTMKWPLCAGD